MTVVYADSVFVLNGLMDYLLFLATARLAGVPLRRRRYVLAALLGGAYGVACFLPGFGFLSNGLVKGSAGVLLALVAFGGEERLLRLTVLLFSLSCGLAGCVLAMGMVSGKGIPSAGGILYTDVNLGVLLSAATAAYLVMTIVFRASAASAVEGRELTLRLSLLGKTVTCKALQDTGNGLRDPLSGARVLVVSWDVMRHLLPWEVSGLLTPQALSEPSGLLEPLRHICPGLFPRLLPYTAVGTGQGLLLTIKLDWGEIGGRKYEGLLAAISPTTMHPPALWGGEKG